MFKPLTRVFAGALIASCVAATASQVLACKVPVFRYALEHWNPDAYRAVILHRGPLSAADEVLAAKLESRIDSTTGSVNVIVDRVDVAVASDEIPLLARTLGDDYRKIESPQIVLYYPEYSQSGPLAWRGALSAENIDALVDSPARQQISKWIIAGESAVWVLIGCGDEKQDATAEQTLRRELARLEKDIKLTDIEIIKAEKDFGDDTKVELRLSFKLITLNRNDPKESVLTETLLRSEADLMDLKEPIAIPVFGRGRSHLALVGKGINSDMIEESCRFLAGDCSCEVKRQNPGVDLVFDVKWDELVVGSAGSDQELPPLSGVGLYNEIKLEEEPEKPSPDNKKSDSVTKEANQAEVKPTSTTNGQNPKNDVAANEEKPKPAQPKEAFPDSKPSEIALKKEVAAVDTDTAGHSDSKSLGNSTPFGERLMLWVFGFIALGLFLVMASIFWLRSQASRQ